MESLALFGTPSYKLVRSLDPDTSHEAAQAIDSTKLEMMVFEEIHRYGRIGCISDQLLATFYHLPYSSVTARYRALLDKGFIEDTGERRPGKSGRNQRVMRVPA